MIRIDNIEKTYGGQTLFKNASFVVEPHERIGLVGRNGSGKTTLFKMIMGEEEPDTGDIIIPRGYRIGHVAQHLNFTKDTILEEASLLLPHDEQDHIYKVERILFGLGFTKKDLDAPPSSFSGGFQVRLNLAKVLVSNPNLLLLDEPTNYLDILSIRWIVQFLHNWKHELIIISHDRGFMDSITTHTALIHRERVRKMQGDTAKIYAQVEVEEEVHEKTRLNEEKKRKHMEKFVERFKAKASKAAAARSRMKMIEKLPKLEVLSEISDLDFSFHNAPIEAKRLVEITGLDFGYVPERPLIQDLQLSIHRKDRIAVIGKNGKGKSTLLKLIAGELEPDSGDIKKHPLTSIAYFGQTNIDRLIGTLTVEEEIGSSNPKLGRTQVRGICGCMMFGGDRAEKYVRVLSGGEKSRVLLGKILATPSNLLLLDEPTNHLDMQSIEALQSAIDEYEGAVVIVTHSEMLLREIAESLIVFQDNKAFWFNGTYDEFLEKIGWCDVDQKDDVQKKNQNSKKNLRQNRAAIIDERSKVLKPLKDEIDLLEAKITKLEEDEARAHAEMAAASHEQDFAKVAELSKDAKQFKDEIDACFARLEEVTAKYEPLSSEFESRLEECK